MARRGCQQLARALLAERRTAGLPLCGAATGGGSNSKAFAGHSGLPAASIRWGDKLHAGAAWAGSSAGAHSATSGASKAASTGEAAAAGEAAKQRRWQRWQVAGEVAEVAAVAPGELGYLLPSQVNHVLCHEAFTVEEVLAVTWSQGRCRDYLPINLATSLHRLATIVKGSDMAKAKRRHLELHRHPGFQYTVQLLEGAVDVMEARACSSALWSLAKLRYNAPPEVLERLAQRVADTLEVEATESVAKVLANSLWGLSRLGHCPTPALLSRLEGLFANYLTRLLEEPTDWQPPHYPQDVGNIFVSLVKLEHQFAPGTAPLLQSVLLRSLPSFPESTLVMTLWALSKVPGAPTPEFAAAMYSHLEEGIATLNPGTLSHLLSIYSSSGHPPSDSFLAAIMEAIDSKLSTYRDLDLVIVLHALASMDRKPPPALAKRLKEALLTHLGSRRGLEDQHLAMALWALTRLLDFRLAVDGRLDWELLEGCDSALVRLLQKQRIASSCLSVCVWSLARLDFNPSRKLLALSATAMRRFLRHGDVKPQSLGQFMWALSSLRWYDPELQDMVGSLLEKQLGASPGGCGTGDGGGSNGGNHGLDDIRQYNQLLMSFATFGHHSPVLGRLVEALAEHVEERWLASESPESVNQAVTNCLWAMALLDMLDAPVTDRLIEVLGACQAGVPSLNRLLPQLYHVHLISKVRAGRTVHLPPHLAAQAKEAWRGNCLVTVTSEFQESIFRVLSQLVPDVKMEDMSEGGMFMIDMAFRDAAGKRVAVEADGPRHFTNSVPVRTLRAYELRNDMLRAEGYIVVNIPFYDWHLKFESEQEQLVYLRQLMADHGVTLP